MPDPKHDGFVIYGVVRKYEKFVNAETKKESCSVFVLPDSEESSTKISIDSDFDQSKFPVGQHVAVPVVYRQGFTKAGKSYAMFSFKKN